MDTKTIIANTDSMLMNVYNRYKIVLDKGEGVYLYDNDGKKYLDFGAGIAVFALGYGVSEFNDTIKSQVDKLIHTSNLFYNVPLEEAAEKICKASGMDRVFLTNSGTEAIEGAIKLARKYYFKKNGKADSEIIAMNHSFHGRSMGALSVTGTKKYREAFEPLIGGAVFAEYNNIEDVKSKINDKTCAIIMETVQGEGGLYPAEPEFIKEIRRLCDVHDILLILDEIQCGMGRTGYMYAYQKYGIMPDIITTAKALGCGIPVGAFAAKDEAAKAFEPGDHGTTYGGNPLASAAVSKVFDLYEKYDVLNKVKETGKYLYDALEKFKKEHSIVKAHRGFGLMQGLEFNCNVFDIILKAMEKNLIIIAAGANVIRFVPPLVIEKKHIDEMISILGKCV